MMRVIPTGPGGFRLRQSHCQTGARRMGSRVSIWGWASLLISAASASITYAQSAATIDAVQLHRPSALRLAAEELADCERSTCPRASELSLLVGYLLLSQGNAAESAKQLVSRPPPRALVPFHAYYLGEALFYGHDQQAAAQTFHQASQEGPDWLRNRARTREAEALLASGDVAAAAPRLEQAAAETQSPELLCERAMARAGTGAAEGARSDWRAIALHHPAHPCAAVAFQRLAQNGKPFRFPFDEGLARARAFLDGGDARNTLAALDSLAADRSAHTAPGAARMALIRGMALLSLGRDQEAEKQIDVALRGPSSVAAEGVLLRAHRALRANENQRARSLMAEIERKYPRESAAEEAGFFVGWLDLQIGRPAEAVKSFEAFQKRHPRARRRDEALWFEGLALLLQGRYGETRAALQNLVRQYPKSSLVPQARYWTARSLQLGGSQADTWTETYEQVIRLFPGSFYALLSSERLRVLGRKPPAAFPGGPKTIRTAIPGELRLAITLAEAGLLRDANEELQQRLERVRSTAQAVEFGHALQQIGEYGLAYALAARVLWGSAYGSKEGHSLALLYPRAYRPMVEREANERQVDPFLIWAVMRRESSFRPEAISAANARGLMQVFPPTASAISAKLAVEAPEPNELFSADVNLKLAVWYLGELMKRFGHPALAAAAYNAGPGPVLKWMEERGSMPLDLFVERIPYKETRAYVKQVVADYFTYCQLYGEPTAVPNLDLALPRPESAGVNF